MKTSLPDPSILRQLLQYEPDTGKLFWLPRGPEMFFPKGQRSAKGCAANFNSQFAGKEAFTAKSDGYKIGSVLGVMAKAHRVAWAIYYGKRPESGIDHINGDPGDNRILNLRDATQLVNMKNCRFRSTNTSGQTGVYWDKSKAKWMAAISVNSKQKFLGYFSDIADAKQARNAAEEKYGYHKNHGRKT